MNQSAFVSDAPNPISLLQITGKEHDRQLLLMDIMKRMMAYFQGAEEEPYPTFSEEIAVRYGRSLFRRRGYHPYEDARGVFRARVLRVEPDGRFVLEEESGQERSYLFKEVQYLL